MTIKGARRLLHGAGLVWVLALTAPVAAHAAEPVASHASSAEIAVQALIDKAQALDPTKDIDASLAAWTAAIDAARALSPANPKLLATALAGRAEPDYYAMNKLSGQAQLDRAGAAIVPLLEARDLFRSANLTHSDEYISLMSDIGAFYVVLPDYPHAEAAQAEGIAVGEAMYGKDSPKLSHNYFNLGMLLYREKKLGEAADYVRRSAEVRYTTEPKLPDTVSALGTAAQLNADAGRPEVAEDLALKAVELAEANLSESHPWRGYALASLGEIYRREGRYADALPLLRKGFDLLSANAGKDHVFTYKALLSLSQTLAATGRFDEALALETPFRDSIKSSVGTVTLRTEIARAETETGRFDAALSDIDSALNYTNGKTYSSQGTMERARALDVKSALLASRGDADGALAAAQEAADIYDKRLPQATPQNAAAHVRLAALQGPAGYPALVDAAARLEASLFDTTSLGEGSLQQAALYRDSFTRLAVSAHTHGDDALAFHALQLASFDPAAEAAGRHALREKAGDTGAQLQALQRQATALRVQRDQAYTDGKSELSQSLAGQLSAVRDQATQVEAALRAALPAYDRLTRPDQTDLATVRQALGAHEAVVVVLPGTYETVVATIDAHAFRLDRRPLSHADLRAQVAAIRASLVPDAAGALPAFDTNAAAKLYAGLFTGADGDRLAGVRRIDVMAQDEAGTVPFSLLLTKAVSPSTPLSDAPWLVRRASVATLAGFTPAQATAQASDLAFVGVGAPLLHGAPGPLADRGRVYRNGVVDLRAVDDLPALPHAADELHTLQAVLHGDDAHLFIGERAREPQLTALNGQSMHVLAFATHGLLSGDLSGLTEPALVLTPPTAVTLQDDGLLSASDIMGMGLKADWVVLSACDTASGSNDSAAGYRGLAQAFLYGGAKTLLVSHWAVRDDIAPDLTVKTVSDRGDAAEALRHAELKVMAAHSHPALWAPFAVVTTLGVR